MRTLLQTIILTIILFVIVAAIAVFQPKPENSSGEYGFPFRFYSYGHIKGESGVGYFSGIIVSDLVYEILTIAAVAFLLVFIRNRVTQKAKTV